LFVFWPDLLQNSWASQPAQPWCGSLWRLWPFSFLCTSAMFKLRSSHLISWHFVATNTLGKYDVGNVINAVLSVWYTAFMYLLHQKQNFWVNGEIKAFWNITLNLLFCFSAAKNGQHTNRSSWKNLYMYLHNERKSNLVLPLLFTGWLWVALVVLCSNLLVIILFFCGWVLALDFSW